MASEKTKKLIEEAKKSENAIMALADWAADDESEDQAEHLVQGLPIAIERLVSSNPEVQLSAARFVSLIGAGAMNEAFKGIANIKKALESPNHEAGGFLCSLLSRMAKKGGLASQLVQAGIVKATVGLMNATDSDVVVQSIIVLTELCETSQEVCEQVDKELSFSTFTDLFKHPDTEIHNAGLTLLSYVAKTENTRKNIAKDSDLVKFIVGELKVADSTGAALSSLSILCEEESIADAASHALSDIISFAKAGVDHAHSLVDQLHAASVVGHISKKYPLETEQVSVITALLKNKSIHPEEFKSVRLHPLELSYIYNSKLDALREVGLWILSNLKIDVNSKEWKDFGGKIKEYVNHSKSDYAKAVKAKLSI